MAVSRWSRLLLAKLAEDATDDDPGDVGGGTPKDLTASGPCKRRLASSFISGAGRERSEKAGRRGRYHGSEAEWWRKRRKRRGCCVERRRGSNALDGLGWGSSG